MLSLRQSRALPLCDLHNTGSESSASDTEGKRYLRVDQILQAALSNTPSQDDGRVRTFSLVVRVECL